MSRGRRTLSKATFKQPIAPHLERTSTLFIAGRFYFGHFMKTIYVIEATYDGISGTILAFESEAKAREICKELDVLPLIEFDVKAVKVVDAEIDEVSDQAKKALEKLREHRKVAGMATNMRSEP